MENLYCSFARFIFIVFCLHSCHNHLAVQLATAPAVKGTSIVLSVLSDTDITILFDKPQNQTVIDHYELICVKYTAGHFPTGDRVVLKANATDRNISVSYWETMTVSEIQLLGALVPETHYKFFLKTVATGGHNDSAEVEIPPGIVRTRETLSTLDCWDNTRAGIQFTGLLLAMVTAVYVLSQVCLDWFCDNRRYLYDLDRLWSYRPT